MTLKFIQPKSKMDYWNVSASEKLNLIRVNTVNCHGVMGKGIAEQFRIRYPAMYAEYHEYCRTGQLLPGSIYQYQSEDCLILNAATKDHWRFPSQLIWVKKALLQIDEILMRRPGSEKDIVAIPALGCGNGGLDWNVVRPMIEDVLRGLKCEIHVFEPPKQTKFF